MADERDSFYRRVVDATHIGVYESTADGRLLRANERLAGIFGYRDAATMCAEPGHSRDRFYRNRADRDRIIERIRAGIDIADFLCEGKRQDGRPLWFTQSATRRIDESGTEIFTGTIVDVTALLEAQARARHAEEAYGSIFANAGVGIYRSSPDGRQLRANPALVAFNGYSSEAELLAAVNDIAAEWYVDPARRAEFKARIERDGRVVDFVSEVFRHGTRERAWVRESAWLVRDAEGKILCYEGMLEDITKRQNEQLTLAEARAREAEIAHGSIYENAGVGIYRASADGRLLRANPALVAFDGYASEAELLAAIAGVHEDWYVDPARRDEFKRRMALDGRVANFVSEVYRHKSRARAWIRESAWAVRDGAGKLLCYEGIVEDVTEQQNEQLKLAEARARALAAEADYRSIFENVDFGVYRSTPEGILQRVNAALARINGFATPEQQLYAVREAGMSGRDWYVDPDRLALFREARNRDGYVRNFESEILRRATGERAWISESGWVVRDADGKVVAFEGTVVDITERRRAEAELRDAKATAEAASAAKSAFLAVMSHELRTPLNAIIGFAEIIAGRLFGPNDARYFEYADDIRASGKHLLELINDILDLSKIVAGRLELFETEIAVEPLYASLAKMFAAGADKAAVSFGIELAEPTLAVRADSMRLQQVLMNLLSNAIKFTPPGGQVRLFARRLPDAICLGVSDTGVGMTQDDARLAVEPFTQIDSQLARRHEGTGLGLAICKELASLHGGTLAIDSEKGKGTTVTLRLPLARSV